jgi:hypothetical protein
MSPTYFIVRCKALAEVKEYRFEQTTSHSGREGTKTKIEETFSKVKNKSSYPALTTWLTSSWILTAMTSSDRGR